MAPCTVTNGARVRHSARPVHFFGRVARCGFCLPAAYLTLVSGKVTEGFAPDGGHTQIMGTDTVPQHEGKCCRHTMCLVRAHSDGTICQKKCKQVCTNFEVKAANELNPDFYNVLVKTRQAMGCHNGIQRWKTIWHGGKSASKGALLCITWAWQGGSCVRSMIILDRKFQNKMRILVFPLPLLIFHFFILIFHLLPMHFFIELTVQLRNWTSIKIKCFYSYL